MLKRFLVVCMCVMAVVAVFGLNDRITYDGFQSAGDMVSGSLSVFEDDVETLRMIAHVVEHYRLGAQFELILSEAEDGGKSAISFVSYKPGGFLDNLEHFSFSSADKANQVYKAFTPITWGFEYNGLFAEAVAALNAIVMLLGIIFTLLFIVVILVFDVVSVAFSVVDAGLYLLGF